MNGKRKSGLKRGSAEQRSDLRDGQGVWSGRHFQVVLWDRLAAFRHFFRVENLGCKADMMQRWLNRSQESFSPGSVSIGMISCGEAALEACLNPGEISSAIPSRHSGRAGSPVKDALMPFVWHSSEVEGGNQTEAAPSWLSFSLYTSCSFSELIHMFISIIVWIKHILNR